MNTRLCLKIKFTKVNQHKKNNLSWGNLTKLINNSTIRVNKQKPQLNNSRVKEKY